MNPLVGVTIPDFDSADVLYLAGSASVLVGEEASSVVTRTHLAVKITIHDAKYVRNGLPFRGSRGDYSPYNPPVRHLVSEQNSHIPAGPSSYLTAGLIKRERLTPSVSRFTFSLSKEATWSAGQYVTLDFEPELGSGYSHMRDDDPQSLNDDYVRTFTVSNPPSKQMQITVRRHGPATNFLWRHNLRVPLEIPVLGFGGEEAFRIPLEPNQAVFIAAGVGITPLLAQAPKVLDAGVPLKLLWSLRYEDLPLAKDTFAKIPGLSNVTKLFVTGHPEGPIAELGAVAEARRINEGDVEEFKGQGAKFFFCTGPALLSALEGWFKGERIVWEDFGY